jgi:hypothetical protein
LSLLRRGSGSISSVTLRSGIIALSSGCKGGTES